MVVRNKEEPYPLGKLLFKTSCLKRGIAADRAESDWKNWEGDFMTKQEWQATAETFLTAVDLERKLGRRT